MRERVFFQSRVFFQFLDKHQEKEGKIAEQAALDACSVLGRDWRANAILSHRTRGRIFRPA
jgi:hypothetical protein